MGEKSEGIATLLATARGLAQQVWRNRWLALGVAWTLSVIFAVAVARVPNRYEATARIYIDTQTVLKPLMAGLAFQPDIDQQVRMLARTLISRPQVERLRADASIGWEPVPAERLHLEVDDLLRRIKVDSYGSGNVYVVSFRDTRPERAVRVVDMIVKTFFNSSNQSKLKDSEEARRFIEDEIRVYEGKLVAAENALKDFKLKNFGLSGVPGPGQDYFARVSTLTDEISKLRLELAAAEQSRDALRRELSSEPPQLPLEAMPGQAVQAPTELDTRLEAQRRQLDELLRRFTEAHPDVQSARRSLDAMETQKRAETEARKRAAESGGRQLAPTNPSYQRIRVSLADAEANVAAVRARVAAQQTRLEQVRALASRVPQVEAELTQLNRDYEIIRKNYEQLVSRRESASLGEKLDQTSSLADFRVIDPPRAASKPVFPDRLAMAGVAALAAIGLGLLVAFVRSHLNPLIDGLKSLQDLTNRPVLGTVSLLRDPMTLERDRKRMVLLSGLFVGLILLQIVWVGWIAVQTRL